MFYFLIYVFFTSQMIICETLRLRRIDLPLKLSKLSLFSQSYPQNPEFKTITSESNEKVKVFKSLLKKKKRDDLGLILIEGHRQV